MTPPCFFLSIITLLYIMNKEKVFENMKGTVESVHEHIEMEYSKDAFALWIFGTKDSVTTMVTRPENMDFAVDSVSAAVASNPVIKDLVIAGIKNLENSRFEGDELIFEDRWDEKPLDRSQILREMDSNLKKMFRIIERGLNTKKMKPNSNGNVPMTTLADYCLLKFQDSVRWTLTESIQAMGTILLMTGCETLDGQDPEETKINFTNSIFKWRKN